MTVTIKMPLVTSALPLSATICIVLFVSFSIVQLTVQSDLILRRHMSQDVEILARLLPFIWDSSTMSDEGSHNNVQVLVGHNLNLFVAGACSPVQVAFGHGRFNFFETSLLGSTFCGLFQFVYVCSYSIRTEHQETANKETRTRADEYHIDL